MIFSQGDLIRMTMKSTNDGFHIVILEVLDADYYDVLELETGQYHRWYLNEFSKVWDFKKVV